MNLHVPGLSTALEQLESLPQTTEEILGHLSRIELLLHELVEIQRSQLGQTVYTQDDLT